MPPKKYDRIGTGYNSTRRADPYLSQRLLTLLQGSPGKQYLDIGCGTGNYTLALAEQGLAFTGVEPSSKMLEIAKKRSSAIHWLYGSAEKIPAKDMRFDGAIATLTIHHWSDLGMGMNELKRVLKPGGRLVIFTSTPKQMTGYWLRHYFPQMLEDSMRQMPTWEQIEKALKGAGLQVAETEKYVVRKDLQDQFLYVGKFNPLLYFQEDIRNGISSFSALAHLAEVEKGLKQLKADLENDVFEGVKARYENDLGDYLYVVAIAN